MDKLLIRGGRRFQGEVTISGAKNAALPGLVRHAVERRAGDPGQRAAVAGRVHHVQAAGQHGCGRPSHEDNPDLVTLDAGGVANRPRRRTSWSRPCGPPSWCWARCWRASAVRRVSLPGGCAIGSRPVDQHIKGLQAMGAQITVAHGYIEASTPLDANGQPTRLKGASITTDMVTVTGTENFLMAAALAEGETILENAAQEPEITDLVDLLVAMGAQIEGRGTSRIRIQGVERLHGLTPAQAHQIIPDRIEAGTFLCAVGAAGGDVTLRKAQAEHLGAVIDKLREAGVGIEAGADWIRVTASSRPKAVGFRTSEYPAFPPTCRPSSWRSTAWRRAAR